MKILGLVMAANFEAVGVLLGAGFLVDYLDNKEVLGWDRWSKVVFPAALVIILISWVNMFRHINRESRRGRNEPKV